MNEEIEQSNQEEEEQLTCPECGKGFQDMRGLTSHARHKHELGKKEILKKINSNNDSHISLSIISGIGAF